LPPEVIANLEHLGFAGPLDEVVAVYTRDPDFVTAWLDHCLRHAATFRNPAGTFRHNLRGATYPPEPLDPIKKYISGDYADLIQH
jgi:hypothetical protein